MTDRWDSDYSLVPTSECMRDMCKGFHAHLHTNRRSSECQEHFDFYTGLYDKTAEDLPFLVQEAQARYPVCCDPWDFDTVLCISHATRMIVNRRQNEALAMRWECRGMSTCHIEFSGGDLIGTTAQPQSMIIWCGIELIGCPRGTGTTRCGVVQGVVYTVTLIDDANVYLTMNSEYQTVPEHAEDDDEDLPDSDVAKAPSQITIPKLDVPKLLRLTHAMCYYTIQGRTLKNKRVLLLDTGVQYFTSRALIVGLSRVTHGAHVSVATMEMEERVTGRRRSYARGI